MLVYTRTRNLYLGKMLRPALLPQGRYAVRHGTHALHIYLNVSSSRARPAKEQQRQSREVRAAEITPHKIIVQDKDSYLRQQGLPKAPGDWRRPNLTPKASTSLRTALSLQAVRVTRVQRTSCGLCHLMCAMR